MNQQNSLAPKFKGRMSSLFLEGEKVVVAKILSMTEGGDNREVVFSRPTASGIRGVAVDSDQELCVEVPMAEEDEKLFGLDLYDLLEIMEELDRIGKLKEV